MASGWISEKARQAVYARDNDTCCYCGRTCERHNGNNSGATISLDHIVSQKSLAAAATDDAHFARMRRDPRNLVVVCTSCNSSKRHIDLYVWCAQTGRDYSAIIAEIARRTAITI